MEQGDLLRTALRCVAAIAFTGGGLAVASATSAGASPRPADEGCTTAVDSYSVGFDTPLTVADVGVLSNDVGCGKTVYQPGGTGPTHGTVTGFTGNGGFTYTPDAGYTGPDSFMYSPTSFEGRNTAVNLTVNPKPCVVVLADDNYTANDGAVTVPSPGVGSNDTLCSSSLSQSSEPTHGTVTFNSDGSFSYQGADGYTGPDQFDYTLAPVAARPAAAAPPTATVHIDVIAKAVATTTTTTTVPVTDPPTTVAATTAPDVATTPPPVPSTTETPTTQLASEAPVVAATIAPTSTSITFSSLPATGSTNVPVLLLALVLLPLGLGCLWFARRRPNDA